MSFHPQTREEGVGTPGHDRLDGARTAEHDERAPRGPRPRRPRWGVVKCPDGLRRLDLILMRRALTRLMVAGELIGDHPNEDLARKAGMSRSTLSRMFSGRAISLKKLLRVLAVLDLTFDEVVSEPALPADGGADRAG